MTRKLEGKRPPKGWADSAERENRVIPPPREPPPPDSGAFEAAGPIAVTVESPVLRRLVLDALASTRRAVGGPSDLPNAGLVIAEPESNVRKQLEALRRIVRPDAALLMVMGSATGETIAAAHAAGAFACLRPPFVPEELLGLVASALDSQATKGQIARLEHTLDLQEHLASIGRMSAGLSHEIGNPVGVAALNTEAIRAEATNLVELLQTLAYAAPRELPRLLTLARARVPRSGLPDTLAAALEDTESSHDRLKNVLQMMRGLMGDPEVRRERVDLYSAVQDTRSTLAADLRRVQVEVIGESAVALADERLVGLILQHLTLNAAQAARSLPAPRVRLHAYVSGDRAVASVRDNGPGIAGDLLDRIFEPFFTTRRNEGGTGLGLATCREYATRMGADLSVWSVPGRGSCFRLFLPVAD